MRVLTVLSQALMLLKGFQEEKNFLLVSTKAKKPDVNGADGKAYEELLKPIQEAIVGATSIKDANRGTPVFNHLNAVAEGIMLLGWITLESKPFKHVDESLNSAQFFGNRVLKEFKDKDPQHTEWVQAYYRIFRELSAYVKEYFPNGIPWNPKGEPFQQAVKAAKESAASAPAKAPPATAGGPPPPPPPPPGPPPVLKINEEKPAPAPAAGGFNAVFSELNKGEAVTKGLRKVDKSEMTHKNPALRAGSTVPDLDSSAARAKSPAPGKKPKPESMRVKKPPKKELVGNKWTIVCYDALLCSGCHISRGLFANGRAGKL